MDNKIRAWHVFLIVAYGIFLLFILFGVTWAIRNDITAGKEAIVAAGCSTFFLAEAALTKS